VHQQAFGSGGCNFLKAWTAFGRRQLVLAIDKTGRRRWTFLWRRGGKTHEIGLGSASAVSLARAREFASEYRDGLAKGVSPLERREAERRARDGKKTFGACADALLDAKSSEWRNAKHRAQWKMTLEEYAKPLRALPVDGVTTEAVLPSCNRFGKASLKRRQGFAGASKRCSTMPRRTAGELARIPLHGADI
jgi:hypothetical protein